MVTRMMMVFLAISTLVVAIPATANPRVIITKEQPRSQAEFRNKRPALSPYFAAGGGTGGDTIGRFRSSFSGFERIRAGGGFFIEGGLSFAILPKTQLRLTGGYEVDNATQFAGEAEFDRIRFDAVLVGNFGIHDVGVGVTGHTNVGFRCDIISVCAGSVDFDDAVGFTVEYAIKPFGYRFSRKSSNRQVSRSRGPRLGLRYTDIDYELQPGGDTSLISGDLDGQSFSAFFGFSF